MNRTMRERPGQVFGFQETNDLGKYLVVLLTDKAPN